MPSLNVVRVLRSPRFRTSFDVVRTTQTLVDGRAQNSEATIPGVSGVITQGNGDQLVRLAEGQRVQGTITVVTEFRLQDGQGGMSADVVVWKGRCYVVTLTSDYSEYGEGFVQAICTSVPLWPAEPA